MKPVRTNTSFGRRSDPFVSAVNERSYYRMATRTVVGKPLITKVRVSMTGTNNQHVGPLRRQNSRNGLDISVWGSVDGKYVLTVKHAGVPEPPTIEISRASRSPKIRRHICCTNSRLPKLQ